MNIELLKRLTIGNTFVSWLRPRMSVAEFHNAAGPRFIIVPDRCMDLYDLS